jgi:hypothetical protein
MTVPRFIGHAFLPFALLVLSAIVATTAQSRVAANGAQAPAQATASPTPCGDAWQIRVHAFPDDAGTTTPSLRRPGCDGVFSDADRLEALSTPLDGPLEVVVYRSGDPTLVFGSVALQREGTDSDLVRTFYLCSPPPYEVFLATRTTQTRNLCPNLSDTRLLTQHDFDASISGRYVEVAWGFWLASDWNRLSISLPIVQLAAPRFAPPGP